MRPPSVDRLAREIAGIGLPHPLLVDVARAAIAAGEPESARERAEMIATRLLRPVINATGVLLHTNLGRAPFGWSQAVGYTNLEFDLATGKRGSRHAHAAGLLARAAGAEEALVVNNGAAAVLLTLAALARGRHVLVSRGELIEIGGGFRVPEILEQSGATLVEVGTTNRTRVDDYARALNDATGLVLKVHTSNYRVVGFTESVTVGELAALGAPLVVDVGSGLLDSSTPWLSTPPPSWIAGEPAVRQTLEAGADLVTFSGDKLLGGPQCGVIAGSGELVERCRSHPLARALRPGGLILGALQDLALAYLRRDGGGIPFWRAASAPVDELRGRAEAIRAAAGLVLASIVDCESLPGAGSLPGVTIPSCGLAIAGDHSEALRLGSPPVIARVHEGTTILDLRTVDPTDDTALVAALSKLT